MKVSILSCIAIVLLVFTPASRCDGQNFSTTASVLPVPKSNKRNVILWVSIGAGLLVVFLVVVITFLAFYRRRIKSALRTILPLNHRPEQTCTSSKLTASQQLDAINFGPRRFSYAELKVATHDFSEEKLLGRGGFGSVYKGEVLDSANKNEKIPVAIKRMAKNSAQGEREFHAEVLSIGRIRHRNLASLLGWCHERDELLLVYDFMAMGSLDQHLYHKSEYPTLPWPCRFHILQGTASALDYLHSGWEKCILHRDIKPSNVLLDSRMTARLGDFGLARLAGHTFVSELNATSRASVRSNVGGTLGYMAPEVFLYGKLTKKADVYSFGMVALEVVCGRRPPGFHSEDEDEGLVEFVWSAYQRGQLLDVMDNSLREFPEMDSREVQHQVTAVLQLGLLCTLLDPALRPPTNRLLPGLTGEVNISLPASRLGSPASGMSASSRASGGKNYSGYFDANNFTYAELRAATEDFSDDRIIFRAIYGNVYKGCISNQDFAIKRVSPNSRDEEFHSEILNMIGRSRHRNLISLLGWCYEKGELLLVYEFMENHSLHHHLHPTSTATNVKPLPWTARFKILVGVAAALDYLHSGCQETCILHKHIKATDVLLDAHMTARVADFGLHSIAHPSLTLKDSPYTAPDAAPSVKSDVYSFGMLALEVVSGRSPHEGFVQWVWSMHQRGQLWDVIDPSLGTAFFEKFAIGSDADAFRNQVDFDFDEVKHRQQITRALQLGLECTLPDPSLRPHSNRLIQALYGDWAVSLPPSCAASSSSSSSSFESEHSSVTDPLLSSTDTVR